MGYLKYVRDLWKKPKENLGDIWRERLIAWRKEPVTVRIANPTRPDRARSLGFRAKQGFIVVRQKVSRGGHRRPNDLGGRRPKHNTLKKVVNKSYQQIAEERAARKYVNCEVLNSYFVAEDGKSQWYEIILVDRAHPQIISDKRINWISTDTNRVFRGLTSSGKKSRGLRNKGKGAEKVRPSQKSNSNRLH